MYPTLSPGRPPVHVFSSRRKIFPAAVSAQTPVLSDTPLARIRALRDEQERLAAANAMVNLGVDANQSGLNESS